MIIQEDTRQKPEKNKHIREQLEALGYTVKRFGGMAVGDYQILGKGDIVIDTKKDMGEVESNLIHDHERFRNECLLAQEAGIKLIILIQDSKLRSMEDVFGWYNIRKKWSPKAASGRTLAKIMYSMKKSYGVDFQFVTKQEVGKRIVELLRVGGIDGTDPIRYRAKLHLLTNLQGCGAGV